MFLAGSSPSSVELSVSRTIFTSALVLELRFVLGVLIAHINVG